MIVVYFWWQLSSFGMYINKFIITAFIAFLTIIFQLIDVKMNVFIEFITISIKFHSLVGILRELLKYLCSKCRHTWHVADVNSHWVGFFKNIRQHLAGCCAMFLFSVFCKIGALVYNAYWFHIKLIFIVFGQSFKLDVRA